MKNKNFTLSTLLLLIFISCDQKTIIDIDKPRIIFYGLLKTNDLLIQMNEPINKFQYFLNDSFKDININFPKANFIIQKDELVKFTGNIMKLNVSDTSGNRKEIEIEKPTINLNPLKLKFFQLQLKYSKKSPQNIVLKADNDGSTKGYKLVLFIRNKKYEIFFADIDLKKNETIKIIFIPKEEIYNKSFRLNGKNVTISFDKFRLSQSYSLIYIIDNKNLIVDYFLYHNSKLNDIEYYSKNKNFNKLKNLLTLEGINPVSFDIKGSTIKKKIQKTNEKYFINEL